MLLMVSEKIRQELLGAKESLGDEKVLVLEKTENSDLLPIGKPADSEFFERLFDDAGPFWETYNKLGLGAIPKNRYMSLIGGRMYFCKNISDRYIYSIGMRKVYDFADGRLVKKRPIDLDNILLLLLAPVDTLKHAAATIVTAFRTNEALEDFKKFKEHVERECVNETGDPLMDAERYLDLAVKCMEFSFLSSIAYFLNVKLRDSKTWQDCELEELVVLAQKDLVGAKKRFGFYSKSPYEISKPRFSEDDSQLASMSQVPIPKNKYIRWRENCKFLAGRCLAKRREAYLKVGKESGLGELVFFLKTDELANASDHRDVAADRKGLFDSYAKEEPPDQFIFVDGKLVEEKKVGSIIGQSVSVKSKVSGKAVFVNSREDFEKDLDGKILISKSLMPDLVETYDRVIGVVSGSGGGLAHSAVIAREMNKVCVVQVKNLDQVKEGDAIEVDGKTGIITITK